MYAENYCYTRRFSCQGLVDRGMFGNPYYAVGMYLHNCSELINIERKIKLEKILAVRQAGNFYRPIPRSMTWLENGDPRNRNFRSGWLSQRPRRSSGRRYDDDVLHRLRKSRSDKG